MDFDVAIPSYSRVKQIGEKTLKMLETYGFPKRKTYIFVSPDQYDEYKSSYPGYKIVKADTNGILETRNFITLYFKDGHKLLQIDDDVVGVYKKVDSKLVEINPIKFAKEAFKALAKTPYSAWGINPVPNPFFMRDNISEDLRYVVAAFRGVINRHDIMLKGYDQKEDVENSIKFYIRDGGILRFNDVTIKTRWYAPGGIAARSGGKEARIRKSKEAVEWLEANFPEYGKVKQRPSGIYEFVLTKKPKV